MSLLTNKNYLFIIAQFQKHKIKCPLSVENIISYLTNNKIYAIKNDNNLIKTFKNKSVNICIIENETNDTNHCILVLKDKDNKIIFDPSRQEKINLKNIICSLCLFETDGCTMSSEILYNKIEKKLKNQEV